MSVAGRNLASGQPGIWGARFAFEPDLHGSEAEAASVLRLARLVTGKRASAQRHNEIIWHAIRIERRLDRRLAARLAKRAFDLFAAGVGLMLLMPVMLVLAVAVRMTSSGPAIFAQTREGLGGKPFRIFKFRTLYHDHADWTGLAQPVSGDARLTPLGRFLRRTNLDELPQLWNVVRGDMSLVGPRPHVPRMCANGRAYDELVQAYSLRLLAVPGITGLAQLRGFRGQTRDAHTARMRIACDIVYLERQSFWLDVKILLLTVVAELWCGGRGE